MIRIILIALCLIPCIGKAQTIENIFTLQAGKVIPKPHLIDSLYQEEPSSAEILISSEKITSGDKTSEYQVSLYNYVDDVDEEPGFFRIIEIKKGNKELLKLKQADGWDTIPKQFTNGSVRYFVTIPLTKKRTALLFVGHCYPSGPGALTIVVLNNEEVTWVYNKEMYPIEITNGATGFSAFVTNGFVQYLSGDDEGNYPMDMETLPYKYHIWSKNGLLKLQNLGKVTEDFLE